MADNSEAGVEQSRRRNFRSKSPRRHHSHSHQKRSRHRSHHHTNKRAKTSTTETLPFNCRQLTKHDYDYHKPMFGLYLDIQKGIFLDELGDTEIKGRWKSFMGKWNRGELSEGWYNPSTLENALISAKQAEDELARESVAKPQSEEPLNHERASEYTESKMADGGSDSDDSIGPALPGQIGKSRGNRFGPSIPNIQDLEFKRELDAEDRSTQRDDIRFARKLDRKEQKAALDELVPRAEAGTRERQLEKKKEVNEKMKSFREKSPGAAEVPDSDLMGGDEGIDAFKKTKEEFERKKNERELRKEEIMRARQAEREERLQEYRQKEEGTMAMLHALAKQNFG